MKSLFVILSLCTLTYLNFGISQANSDLTHFKISEFKTGDTLEVYLRIKECFSQNDIHLKIIHDKEFLKVENKLTSESTVFTTQPLGFKRTLINYEYSLRPNFSANCINIFILNGQSDTLYGCPTLNSFNELYEKITNANNK